MCSFLGGTVRGMHNQWEICKKNGAELENFNFKKLNELENWTVRLKLCEQSVDTG